MDFVGGLAIGVVVGWCLRLGGETIARAERAVERAAERERVVERAVWLEEQRQTERDLAYPEYAVQTLTVPAGAVTGHIMRFESFVDLMNRRERKDDVS